MSLAAHQVDTHATAGNTWQCCAWREGIYQRHPDFAWVWRQKHKAIASKSGYVAANQWLRLQPRRLKFANTGLYCYAHDEEITNYCEAKAKKTEKRIYEAATHNGDLLTLETLVDYLKEVCTKAGIKFPAKEQDTKENLKAAVRRMVEPRWWRLQVRKETRRQYETYAREMHLVSQTRQTYCSDTTLQRRTLQRKRNRHLLEKMEAENSQGQVYTLAELADLSVSNPMNRRHELMARIRGFEEYSQNHDYL
ncbi:MAG: replication endonuclease, partial [Cellvibrionaceae bacterium]|nr:replication endonuclease [Cellvibrionaceae bacterium]